jgi:hypothetical protein
MAKKVQISVTYLFEYDEETLRERFDDLDTEEKFERAARIMLFGENMNEYEPNDIEIEVIN